MLALAAIAAIISFGKWPGWEWILIHYAGLEGVPPGVALGVIVAVFFVGWFKYEISNETVTRVV
jgi:hypothetical protein